MDFLRSSPDVIEKIMAAYGQDERSVKDAVQHLREWLNLQPHLPHNCEDGRLERWFLICKGSIERAKISIDMYYTLKNVIPELLMDRDPASEWFQNVRRVGFAVALPQLTEEYHRVLMAGLKDTDPNKVNITHVFKAFLMLTDIGFSEDYNLGVISVFDMEGVSIGHITKVTLPLLRNFFICFLKALNMRIKGIYFVNSPPVTEILVNLMKPLLSEKIASRIHAYPKGSTKLTEKISSKVLPVEYGGEGYSIKDIDALWIKKVDSYRDWFLEQDKCKADESKRPGKAFDSGELFGFEGSFRQLSVD